MTIIDSETGEVLVRDSNGALVDKPGPIVLHKVGLEVVGELAFDEWQQFLGNLNLVQGSIHWWLGDAVNYGERKYGETYAQAVEVTGFDDGTLRNDAWVANRIELSRRHDNLSFGHHQEVAALEPDQQDYWLNYAEAERKSQKELRYAIRMARLEARLQDIELPEDKYSIIYADPPWRYDFPISESRAIENQYPTMSIEEIRALPIADLAADNAVLFLWATNPLLPDALTVIEAWGFTYRTNMVWVKDRIGMGFYARQRHELLLVAIKGEPSVPMPDDRPDSVIESPRGKHSAKPDEVYHIVERMYPAGKRIELFARTPMDGWEPWGNEIGNRA